MCESQIFVSCSKPFFFFKPLRLKIWYNFYEGNKYVKLWSSFVFRFIWSFPLKIFQSNFSKKKSFKLMGEKTFR